MCRYSIRKDFPWIRRCLLTVLLALSYIFQASAQPTIVRGKVTDKEAGKPIPYVTILFQKTPIGTTTDSLGHYQLIGKTTADSVQFSSIGHIARTIHIKTQTTNDLDVSLKADLIDLPEVTALPDDGPTRRLIKEMIDRKKLNNPAKYQRYSYRKYSKWEYHLANVKEKMINSRVFRHDQSVFKTDTDSSKFLPIYFSEQIVFNEIQRNPDRQKSTVLADKTSGVGVLEDYEITGYTSALDIEVNFYDNYINLFSQNFVSPLADNGWFYYKYFIADSTEIDGVKNYRIRFIPRRVGDKVFKGYMTTENKNFAIIDIDGELSSTSNINFMKSMRLTSSYQMLGDTLPFYKRNQIDALFNYVPLRKNPSKKPISIFFTQSAIIDSVSVNQDKDVTLTTTKGKFETIKLNDANLRDSEYWDNQRPEELNQREQQVNEAIDAVSQVKAIKFADNIARMTMTGYYDLGRFEFGPYMSAINTNKVEGLHLFAGARTSSEISTRYMAWGGIGYGFKNKKMNGIAGFGYKFPANNRQIAKISYDDKLVRSGENEKILLLYENSLSPTENNLISQIFKRDELDELFREQKLSGSYEYEWRHGLMNKLGVNYIRHYSPQFYPFLHKGNPLNHVSAIEVNLGTRLSWMEKIIDDKFLRIYMSTDYPIINFNIGGGKVYYAGEENYYGKILTTVKHNLRMGQTIMNYAIEGGMYFGKLPYTMLDIPRGNETQGLFTYDFNLLNYMEYAHDKYLHGYFEYHLNGFVFNRLPLLKRIGLREVLSAKTMIGSTSEKNRDIVEFANSISTMSNPYIELGAGVENIFRLFRAEAVWRVRPQSQLGAPSFGIRVKFEIKL